MGHKKLVKIDRSRTYPDFLKRSFDRTVSERYSNHPIVIRMDKPKSADQLEKIIKKGTNLEIIDNYDEQYAELLLSRYAHLYRAKYQVQTESIKKHLEAHYNGVEPWRLGSWVYYPWNNSIVHVLAQKEFEELRTVRNKDLITVSEQKKLLDFSVASFGMSVGSAGALALGITGISRRSKLIDGAVISGSNLNRIMTGIASVGKGKADIIGRQLYEMNPYSEISYFDKAKVDNINEIFNKPWSVDLVIDEIDSIDMKVRIRHEAKKQKIPVLMATELGDTVMLDVERYDLEPERELFHGIVPGIEKLLDSKLENYREWTKHAVRIIDPKNMPLKMQKSLLKIGSTIVTHPQLGSTVMITGGVLAFAVKNIALGNLIKSGRYVISLEDRILADHKTRNYKRKHKKHTKVILSSIDSM